MRFRDKIGDDSVQGLIREAQERARLLPHEDFLDTWPDRRSFESRATPVRLGPDGQHPAGCHTASPTVRDCNSDGHESCYSCSRRVERDELVWREGGIVVPQRTLSSRV